MKLREFIESERKRGNTKATAQIATAIGITRAGLSHIVLGRRGLAAKYLIPIEKATGGLVTRQELAPHLYE